MFENIKDEKWRVSRVRGLKMVFEAFILPSLLALTFVVIMAVMAAACNMVYQSATSPDYMMTGSADDTTNSSGYAAWNAQTHLSANQSALAVWNEQSPRVNDLFSSWVNVGFVALVVGIVLSFCGMIAYFLFPEAYDPRCEKVSDGGVAVMIGGMLFDIAIVTCSYLWLLLLSLPMSQQSAYIMSYAVPLICLVGVIFMLYGVCSSLYNLWMLWKGRKDLIKHFHEMREQGKKNNDLVRRKLGELFDRVWQRRE